MWHTLGEIRHKYDIFIVGGQGKGHLGDIGVDVIIILKWIFKENSVNGST
jgi:hypothetical protein